MATNEQVDFYLNHLRERLNILQKQFDDFLMHLALDDRLRKTEKARALITALDDLKRAIHSGSVPSWLPAMHRCVGRYTQTFLNDPAEASLSVMQKLIELAPQMNAQTWDASSADGIDIAAISESLYQQSRIQEMFDELATQLQNIIDSGEIDSVKAIKTFEGLIATIRKNSHSDYFASRSMWEIVRRFFRNVVVEVAESTPGLRQAYKAACKTMVELDVRFADLQFQLRTGLNEKIVMELPNLPRLKEEPDDDMPLLGFHPIQSVLHETESDDGVIDVESEPASEPPPVLPDTKQ
jgi:hypothetical protein